MIGLSVKSIIKLSGMIDPETRRPDAAFTPDQLEAMQASDDTHFVFSGFVGREISRLSRRRDAEAQLEFKAAQTHGIIRYVQVNEGDNLEVRFIKSLNGEGAAPHPRRDELPPPYRRFNYFFRGTVCARPIPGEGHSLYEFWEIDDDTGLGSKIVITAEDLEAGDRLEEVAPGEQAEMMAALEAKAGQAERRGEREVAEMHRAALGDLALMGCRWVPGYVPASEIRVIMADEASGLSAIIEDALSSGGPILP